MEFLSVGWPALMLFLASTDTPSRFQLIMGSGFPVAVHFSVTRSPIRTFFFSSNSWTNRGDDSSPSRPRETEERFVTLEFVFLFSWFDYRHEICVSWLFHWFNPQDLRCKFSCGEGLRSVIQFRNSFSPSFPLPTFRYFWQLDYIMKKLFLVREDERNSLLLML